MSDEGRGAYESETAYLKDKRDEGCAIMWYLNQMTDMHLVMLVYSGSKSVHGWWQCSGRSDEELAPFVQYAMKLRCDPANFRNRSQFVRMPGAVRDNGTLQSLIYIHPTL